MSHVDVVCNLQCRRQMLITIMNLVQLSTFNVTSDTKYNLIIRTKSRWKTDMNIDPMIVIDNDRVSKWSTTPRALEWNNLLVGRCDRYTNHLDFFDNSEIVSRTTWLDASSMIWIKTAILSCLLEKVTRDVWWGWISENVLFSDCISLSTNIIYGSNNLYNIAFECQQLHRVKDESINCSYIDGASS